MIAFEDGIFTISSQTKLTDILVSIVIPIYNRAWSLSYCVKSVIQQTHHNLEILCIDDASTDNSIKLLRQFKATDDRIKIIRNKTNIGAAQSRNIGIDVAKGKYIYFLDSDDYLEDNAIEELLSQSEAVNADICMCKVFYENIKTNSNIHTVFLKTEFLNHQYLFNIYSNNVNLLLSTHRGVHNKFFLRKFIIENNILFQNMLTTNDVYFINKTLLLAKRVTYVDKSLMTFVQHCNERIEQHKCNNWRNSIIAYDASIQFLKYIIQYNSNIYSDFYSCVIFGLYYNYSLLTDETIKKLYKKEAIRIISHNDITSNMMATKKHQKALEFLTNK